MRRPRRRSARRYRPAVPLGSAERTPVVGAGLLASVPLGVGAGSLLADGELLALLLAELLGLGPVPVTDAEAEAEADGLTGIVGDGEGFEAGPTAPPPSVVPWPGLPWTTADSGLPAAPSTTVTTAAPATNAARMTTIGLDHRQRRLGRPC